MKISIRKQNWKLKKKKIEKVTSFVENSIGVKIYVCNELTR